MAFCMCWSVQYQLFWNRCFSLYSLHFRLSRQSVNLLCAQISARCLGYTLPKIWNCWRSIDAHFNDRVMMISCTVMTENAAIIWSLNYCHNVTLRLAKVQHPKSLMLRWNSFSRWGWEPFALVFALKGGNIACMDVCNQLPFRWPKMQSQKLLTLCWRSFSGWGSDHVVFSFAYKCGQYIHYL